MYMYSKVKYIYIYIYDVIYSKYNINVLICK